MSSSWSVVSGIVASRNSSLLLVESLLPVVHCFWDLVSDYVVLSGTSNPFEPSTREHQQCAVHRLLDVHSGQQLLLDIQDCSAGCVSKGHPSVRSPQLCFGCWTSMSCSPHARRSFQPLQGIERIFRRSVVSFNSSSAHLRHSRSSFSHSWK